MPLGHFNYGQAGGFVAKKRSFYAEGLVGGFMANIEDFEEVFNLGGGI